MVQPSLNPALYTEGVSPVLHLVVSASLLVADEGSGAGSACRFVASMLSLNGDCPRSQVVKVSVLAEKAISANLAIPSQAVTLVAVENGKDSLRYAGAQNAHLFLSACEQTAAGAIEAGLPAATVPLKTAQAAFVLTKGIATIVFDFDRTSGFACGRQDAPDQHHDADMVFDRGKGAPALRTREAAHADHPALPGPLNKTLIQASAVRGYMLENPGLFPERKLNLYIASARDELCKARIHTSLRDWGVVVDDVFCVGTNPKTDVLRRVGGGVLFDDKISAIGKAVAKGFDAFHVPCDEERAERLIRRASGIRASVG
jgi:5'-nucleotidase